MNSMENEEIELVVDDEVSVRGMNAVKVDSLRELDSNQVEELLRRHADARAARSVAVSKIKQRIHIDRMPSTVRESSKFKESVTISDQNEKRAQNASQNPSETKPFYAWKAITDDELATKQSTPSKAGSRLSSPLKSQLPSYSKSSTPRPNSMTAVASNSPFTDRRIESSSDIQSKSATVQQEKEIKEGEQHNSLKASADFSRTPIIRAFNTPPSVRYDKGLSNVLDTSEREIRASKTEQMSRVVGDRMLRALKAEKSDNKDAPSTEKCIDSVHKGGCGSEAEPLSSEDFLVDDENETGSTTEVLSSVQTESVVVEETASAGFNEVEETEAAEVSCIESAAAGSKEQDESEIHDKLNCAVIEESAEVLVSTNVDIDEDEQKEHSTLPSAVVEQELDSAAIEENIKAVESTKTDVDDQAEEFSNSLNAAVGHELDGLEVLKENESAAELWKVLCEGRQRHGWMTRKQALDELKASLDTGLWSCSIPIEEWNSRMIALSVHLAEGRPSITRSACELLESLFSLFIKSEAMNEVHLVQLVEQVVPALLEVVSGPLIHHSRSAAFALSAGMHIATAGFIVRDHLQIKIVKLTEIWRSFVAESNTEQDQHRVQRVQQALELVETTKQQFDSAEEVPTIVQSPEESHQNATESDVVPDNTAEALCFEQTHSTAGVNPPEREEEMEKNGFESKKVEAEEESVDEKAVEGKSTEGVETTENLRGNERMDERLSSLEERLNGLIREKSDLERIIGQYEATLRQMLGKKEEESIHEHKESVVVKKQLEAENNKLKAELMTNAEAFQALRLKYDGHKQSLLKAEEQLKKSSAANRILKQTVVELNAWNSSFKSQAEAKLTESHELVTAYKNQFEERVTALLAEREVRTAAVSRAEQAERKTIEAEGKVRLLETESEIIRRQLNCLKEESSKSHSSKQKSDLELNHMRSTHESTLEELKLARGQIDALNKRECEYNSARARHNELEEENQNLKARAYDNMNTIREMEERLKKMQSQMSSSSAVNACHECSESELRMKALEAKLKIKEEELQSALIENANLQSICEEVIRDHEADHRTFTNSHHS